MWADLFIYAGHIFRILKHAELFGIFHFFTLFLEEFDNTARVQHALAAVERQ